MERLPKLIACLTDWSGKRLHHQVLTYADPANGNTTNYERITLGKPGVSPTGPAGAPHENVIIICRNALGELLLVDEFDMAVGETVTSFPMGTVNPGETALQAARRELMAQTGVVIGSTDYGTHTVDWADPTLCDTLTHIVPCRGHGRVIPKRLGWERTEPFWLRPDEIPSLLNNGRRLDLRLRLYLMNL